jgi:hypothetical protein
MARCIVKSDEQISFPISARLIGVGREELLSSIHFGEVDLLVVKA